MASSARSRPQPAAAKKTPGADSAPPRALAMSRSMSGSATMPAATMPLHSPMLWPRTASGSTAHARSTRSTSRLTPMMPSPACSIVRASTPSGTARPKRAARSSTRGWNCASRPGKAKARRPPSWSRPRGLNQMPSRPVHGLPLSTMARARASRSAVGSRTARRHGPVPDFVKESELLAGMASTAGDAAAARNRRSSARRGIRRGATTPSMTTWALMPPKPNALTAARRSGCRHSSTRVTRRKRVRSTASCGSSQCSVGGSTPWCAASAALMSPAAPAAGMAWPIIDFTVPRPARSPSAGPKKRRRVSSSAASPAGVPVPCASTSPTLRGSSPAACQARSSASTWPSTRGFMRLASRPSEATPVPRMTA